MTIVILLVRLAFRQGQTDANMMTKDACNDKHEKVQEDLQAGALCMAELRGITQRLDDGVKRIERIVENNGG